MTEEKTTIDKLKEARGVLVSLAADFKVAREKAMVSFRPKIIGKRLYFFFDLSSIVIVIKKYLSFIESEPVLLGFINGLNREIKFSEDNNEELFELGLKKIKNTEKKSWNWVYYELFKELVGSIKPFTNAIIKSLARGNTEPLRKVILEEFSPEKIKEVQEKEKEFKKELKKFGVYELCSPFIYKKLFNDFHKSLICWIDIHIMASEISGYDSTNKALIDKWEDLLIEFTNEYDVKTVINGKVEYIDYKKLGFADARKDSNEKTSAVKSWSLLTLFSSQNGRVKIDKFAWDRTRKQLFTKTKQDLSDKLKNYFGLKSDPIFFDKNQNEYQMSIKLTPPPAFRESWQDRDIFEAGNEDI
jgi:hypothetical protein